MTFEENRTEDYIHHIDVCFPSLMRIKDSNYIKTYILLKNIISRMIFTKILPKKKKSYYSTETYLKEDLKTFQNILN